MIEFENVCKTYQSTGHEALHDISLKINDGEFVYIVGPNGSGKSTLVKLLNCEERLTSGKIFFDEYKLHRIKRRQIPYLRRKVGMVFQNFNLIDTMTVFDNVAFALRVTDRPPREVRRKVPTALQVMGLIDKALCKPGELSGGEQQKVGIARALVGSPNVIIADEPTGNGDPEMSAEILELLDEINRTGTTVIMVTHHRDFIRQMPRRVIMLEDGRITFDEDLTLSGPIPPYGEGDAAREAEDYTQDGDEATLPLDDMILDSGFVPDTEDEDGE